MKAEEFMNHVLGHTQFMDLEEKFVKRFITIFMKAMATTEPKDVSVSEIDRVVTDHMAEAKQTMSDLIDAAQIINASPELDSSIRTWLRDVINKLTKTEIVNMCVSLVNKEALFSPVVRGAIIQYVKTVAEITKMMAEAVGYNIQALSAGALAAKNLIKRYADATNEEIEKVDPIEYENVKATTNYAVDLVDCINPPQFLQFLAITYPDLLKELEECGKNSSPDGEKAMDTAFDYINSPENSERLKEALFNSNPLKGIEMDDNSFTDHLKEEIKQVLSEVDDLPEDGFMFIKGGEA